MAEKFPERESEIRGVFDDMKKKVVRNAISKDKRRPDGRKSTDVRPITCEVQVLPRTHGSAVFTRGETQALAVATLGTSSDEQKVDALTGEYYRKFMLHYNFPPFSVGEVKFLRSPGPARDRPRRARRAGDLRRAARTRRIFPTRSASSPKSSSRTARRRWRRCAAALWR